MLVLLHHTRLSPDLLPLSRTLAVLETSSHPWSNSGPVASRLLGALQFRLPYRIQSGFQAQADGLEESSPAGCPFCL
jgi:hypothetical protein